MGGGILSFFRFSEERLTLMSNNSPKQISVSSKPNKAMKNIELWKFYLIFDGSYPGHPGLIVWKDDDANLYLAIKFGTSSCKNNVEFKYPIEERIKKSYVYKRFFLGKRKDFGSQVLNRLFIKPEDIEELLQTLDLQNPLCSKNVTGRSLHSYIFLIKKCHRST